MFLKSAQNGDLVEVLDLPALFDPLVTVVKGCFHAGEEMPDPDGFSKADLLFPSGESLPMCWCDPDYKG